MAPDHQQAALLEILGRTPGAPVSYDELRAAGIEFPASVVSELELAGASIERCTVDDDSGGLGVRLRSEHAPALVPVRSGAGSVRWPAPAALAVVGAIVAVVIALALIGGDGHGAPAPAARQAAAHWIAAAHRHRGTTVASDSSTASSATASTTVASVSSTASAASTPVSPALATALEAQGHGLLASGEYAGAIAVLRRAVSATGESVSDCAQPASETCLTYAYALFDLGRALRLSGQAGAAIPILRARLQIDNQQATVQDELDLALAAQPHG